MKEILKELNVEKLNICEKDGTVKMTLFNSDNIPSLIMDNEDLLPGHREKDGISGAMFYNNHGDECGGLIYASSVNEDGVVEMGMSLTFDKWKQDQLLQLHLQKQGEKEQYGFSIYDRPNIHVKESLEIMKQYHKEENIKEKNKLAKQLMKDNHKRIFVGHDYDGQTKISMFNNEGQEKLKLYIDDEGEPQLSINGKRVPIERLI